MQLNHGASAIPLGFCASTEASSRRAPALEWVIQPEKTTPHLAGGYLLGARPSVAPGRGCRRCLRANRQQLYFSAGFTCRTLASEGYSVRRLAISRVLRSSSSSAAEHSSAVPAQKTAQGGRRRGAGKLGGRWGWTVQLSMLGCGTTGRGLLDGTATGKVTHLLADVVQEHVHVAGVAGLLRGSLGISANVADRARLARGLLATKGRLRRHLATDYARCHRRCNATSAAGGGIAVLFLLTHPCRRGWRGHRRCSRAPRMPLAASPASARARLRSRLERLASSPACPVLDRERHTVAAAEPAAAIATGRGRRTLRRHGISDVLVIDRVLQACRRRASGVSLAAVRRWNAPARMAARRARGGAAPER